jgi:hypothetical protein
MNQTTITTQMQFQIGAVHPRILRQNNEAC